MFIKMFPKKIFILPIFLLFFFSHFTYSQDLNLTALTISDELKENANAVVRDNSVEITIEDVDKMTVSRRKVVTVLNKLGKSDARIGASYDNDTKITKLTAIIYNAFGKQIKKYRERDFLDISAVDGGTLYSDSRVKYIDYKPIAYPYTLVFVSEYKTSSTGFIPSWFPVNGYYVSVEKSQYKLNNLKKIKVRKKEKNFEGFSIKDNSNEFDVHYELTNQNAIEYENSSGNSGQYLMDNAVSNDVDEVNGLASDLDDWVAALDLDPKFHDVIITGFHDCLDCACEAYKQRKPSKSVHVVNTEDETRKQLLVAEYLYIFTKRKFSDEKALSHVVLCQELGLIMADGVAGNFKAQFMGSVSDCLKSKLAIYTTEAESLA